MSARQGVVSGSIRTRLVLQSGWLKIGRTFLRKHPCAREDRVTIRREIAAL